MPATLDIPKPTHREVTPARRCMECGAWLRTGNESTTCDPCGTPPWEVVEDEVLERIGAMTGIRNRREAFDAYVELGERSEPAEVMGG